MPSDEQSGKAPEDAPRLSVVQERAELAHRIELENGLLNSRTGHVLAIHGFLVTALAIFSNGNFLWFRHTLCVAGLALAVTHFFIGLGTLLSIIYWSKRLAEQEDRMNIAQNLRFNANLDPKCHGSPRAALTWSVNIIIAIIVPIGLFVFWWRALMLIAH